MRKMANEGSIKSVNRLKEEIIQSMIEKGGLLLSSWFLKGRTGSVISCQLSPGAFLARKLKEFLNDYHIWNRILVTKDDGLPIISQIRRTDPFKTPYYRFKDPNCIVEQGKDCAKTGLIYEITCM